MNACAVAFSGRHQKDRLPTSLRGVSAGCCLAFTLIEMIAVMAIIVILATLVVPAAGTMLRGNDLTQAGQDLSGQLGAARQLALTQNRPVELRIYQYADPTYGSEPAANWKFRGVQTFSVSEAGNATPSGKVHALPKTVILDSGKRLSTLIGNALPPDSTKISGPVIVTGPQTFSLPTVGKSYNYVAFRFLPDGSTNLPLPTTAGSGSDVNNWFITAHQTQYGDNLGTAPDNFLTLQIDPFNGNVREFRP